MENKTPELKESQGKQKPFKQLWSFPRIGKSVMAVSREAALKMINKSIKK